MLFSSLETHVRNNFKGMLIIGDLHADFTALQRAVKYAEEQGLFLMSLGDLVDRGNKPYEVIKLMYSLMIDGKAGLTLGNHDDRFRRYYDHLKGIGSLGSFSNDAQQTLSDVGIERMEEFLSMYYVLQTTDSFSSVVHTFDDFILVHAASHPTIWDSWIKFDGAARSRFLYGETTGEVLADGMPVRLYNWIDEVPTGRTVIVGHDRKPIFDIAITEPLYRTNAKGGKAIFIDTGCGKGGFLSGIVIKEINSRFEIDQHLTFKDINEIF